MKEKLLAFAKGGAPNAAKLATVIAACWGLYCKFMGRPETQIDQVQAATILTVILSIIASHLDSRAIKVERKETAAARDAAHANNAQRINDLEGTVMSVAQGVQVVAEKTGTDLQVPRYTPTPAVPADRLREIMEEEKRKRS